MIVTAKDPIAAEAMLGFLSTHGVNLPWSTDLRFLARVNDEGKLLGVVAYNGFIGHVCSIHCAGDGNWISREFLKAAFSYPFKAAGMMALICTVASSNLHSLRLVTHLGFKEFAAIPLAWDGVSDLVILKMMREDCRWIKDEEHEQQTA
jgi:RimJ/RimL family protein N-acetyltransferase